MIPKTIHYCWFGGKKKPKCVEKCIASWQKKCPDYTIIEWNENNFDINQSKFTKSAYDQKAWAFVSDYARLKIILEHGGIYLDTDVELLKSLDELLDKKAFFGAQQLDGRIATGLGFGATKNHPLIKALLDEYKNIVFSSTKKMDLACPKLNKKAFDCFGVTIISDDEITEKEEYTIFPPRYFDPISPGCSDNLICSDTYSVHHYDASWTNKGNRIKRAILKSIGQDKVILLKKVLKR